jgi:lysylphosphatidylglycerol synthetase-like protein (DUF2156 family)
MKRAFGESQLPTFLLAEQQQHGYNAHSLVSLAPGAQFWTCPQLEGAIIYQEIGKVWLVSGDPLTATENVTDLARRFIKTARDEGRYVAFMPATERFALATAELDLRAVKIGAAPYFDLATWGPRGDRAKKARAGSNQARRAGVIVKEVTFLDSTVRQETSELCASWLKNRRCAAKLDWLLALDPFLHANRKKFFTARDGAGRLVGFLTASPIPAREGWYLEDVIRDPNAPPGTADLLVVETLTALKLEGARLATLGTSPLARDGTKHEPGNRELWDRLLRLSVGSFSFLYNFEGLRRFKSKFAPSWWESEYLLIPRDLIASPRIASALIQVVVPNGASNLVVRQLARRSGLEQLSHLLKRKSGYAKLRRR